MNNRDVFLLGVIIVVLFSPLILQAQTPKNQFETRRLSALGIVHWQEYGSMEEPLFSGLALSLRLRPIEITDSWDPNEAALVNFGVEVAPSQNQKSFGGEFKPFGIDGFQGINKTVGPRVSLNLEMERGNHVFGGFFARIPFWEHTTYQFDSRERTLDEVNFDGPLLITVRQNITVLVGMNLGYAQRFTDHLRVGLYGQVAAGVLPKTVKEIRSNLPLTDAQIEAVRNTVKKHSKSASIISQACVSIDWFF